MKKHAVKAESPNGKRDSIQEKKQTVHVGYGYASGDNYRLGYNRGGMGGIAESFNGKVQPIGDDVIVKRSGMGVVAASKRAMNMPGAYGMATPYGHPVTHPGFTTMGFPGHAMAEATIEVKSGIPEGYPFHSQSQHLEPQHPMNKRHIVEYPLYHPRSHQAVPSFYPGYYTFAQEPDM